MECTYTIRELEVMMTGLNVIDPHTVFVRQLKDKILADIKVKSSKDVHKENDK